MLGSSENGFRDFTDNRHPIPTPDDLKGLKKCARCESPVYVDIDDYAEDGRHTDPAPDR